MSGLPILPSGSPSGPPDRGFADATLARIVSDPIDAEIRAERAILVGVISGIEEAVAVGCMAEAEMLLTLLPGHVLGAPTRYFSSSCLLGIGTTIAALRTHQRGAA